MMRFLTLDRMEAIFLVIGFVAIGFIWGVAL